MSPSKDTWGFVDPYCSFGGINVDRTRTIAAWLCIAFWCWRPQGTRCQRKEPGLRYDAIAPRVAATPFRTPPRRPVFATDRP